jgi:3-methyl-2-oxobutanoate hydroxymethyltransferase
VRSQRPTVFDILAMKGTRQLTMLNVETLEEAEAAQAAGIDMLSVQPTLLGPEFRDAAPTCFVVPGLDEDGWVSAEEYLRAAFAAIAATADAVYVSASLEIVRRLRAEGVPVCGHVGLVPSQATWTGGFRAVGKTAASALDVFRRTKALEEAGAFAAEIEVVPHAVAAAICERTSLFLISMGSGTGCDAQYLFARDVLGSHDGHYPRHAKRYRDFRTDYARLQRERVAAFSEFAADVGSGAFPAPGNVVPVAAEELRRFLAAVDSEDDAASVPRV